MTDADNKKENKTGRVLSGRIKIKTSVGKITEDNLIKVLRKAETIHDVNSSDIQYLYDYYRGKQPILQRVKQVRPEINNKIVENRANEIVSFKVGYLCGEPIQYVSRNSDDNTADEVTKLNEFMFSEDKASQDQEIVEWQMICGTAYRLVLPDSGIGEDKQGIIDPEDECPFEMFTLDPRSTFVVYSTDVGNRPLMGVKITLDDDMHRHYSIYTDTDYFLVIDNKIIQHQKHALGCVPIFEYPANNSRLGSFEIVLPLLDAINTIESNRLDGIEQTIQAFIKFINCDISAEDFDNLREMGAIKVKSIDGQQADVDMVTNTLNQDQTQTTKEDFYNSILTICGIPNRNGGTSTSDTGAAVLLRDGWSLAEARAKDSEHMFKRAEKKMLRLVLKLCRTFTDLNLKLSDIDMKFTRRNYEAIQSKSQVLISMLQQPKIHPKLAFENCGMFPDPETAYALSMDYYQEQMEKWEPTALDNESGDDELNDKHGPEQNVPNIESPASPNSPIEPKGKNNNGSNEKENQSGGEKEKTHFGKNKQKFKKQRDTKH